MKEFLIKLATGVFAKLLRYVITVAGGAAVAGDGKEINVEHVAGGLAAIVVAFGWSLWEDRIKRKASVAERPDSETGLIEIGEQPTKGKSVKTIINSILVLISLLAFSAGAASPWSAGNWSVSPFAAHKVTETALSNGKWGGGVALTYAPADNVEIEASALSYSLTDAPVVESVDEAAVNFKGYLPLGKSGWAPYGLIGYTRDHAGDGNMMNAGAGLSWRWKHAELFGDGQYRTGFEARGNQLLFRVGGGVTF